MRQIIQDLICDEKEFKIKSGFNMESMRRNIFSLSSSIPVSILKQLDKEKSVSDSNLLVIHQSPDSNRLTSTLFSLIKCFTKPIGCTERGKSHFSQTTENYLLLKRQSESGQYSFSFNIKLIVRVRVSTNVTPLNWFLVLVSLVSPELLLMLLVSKHKLM